MAGRPGRIQKARTTAPAGPERLASPPPRPDLGSGGPLDGSPSRGEHPSRGRRRPPPANVIRLEFLSPKETVYLIASARVEDFEKEAANSGIYEMWLLKKRPNKELEVTR